MRAATRVSKRARRAKRICVASKRRGNRVEEEEEEDRRERSRARMLGGGAARQERASKSRSSRSRLVEWQCSSALSTMPSIAHDVGIAQRESSERALDVR